MAKILISFLGTGRINKEGKSKREYEKAKYEIDGQLYEETFVTKALDTHYNIDKVFYIGTLKSMWEEVYRSYRDVENLDEDVYFQLAGEIDSFDERSDVVERRLALGSPMGCGQRTGIDKGPVLFAKTCSRTIFCLGARGESSALLGPA